MSGYRAGFSKYHSVQWSIQEAIEAPRFATHAYDPGLLKIEERLF